MKKRGSPGFTFSCYLSGRVCSFPSLALFAFRAKEKVLFEEMEVMRVKHFEDMAQWQEDMRHFENAWAKEENRHIVRMMNEQQLSR